MQIKVLKCVQKDFSGYIAIKKQREREGCCVLFFPFFKTRLTLYTLFCLSFIIFFKILNKDKNNSSQKLSRPSKNIMQLVKTSAGIKKQTNKQNRYKCLMLEGAKEIISEDAHRQWKEYRNIYSQHLHVNKRQRCGTDS